MGFTEDPQTSDHPTDNDEYDTPLGLDYNSVIPGVQNKFLENTERHKPPKKPKINDHVRRQESKEYFNKTSRKDDSLIESNPELQIFSIEEEDTWRTSQKSMSMSMR